MKDGVSSVLPQVGKPRLGAKGLICSVQSLELELQALAPPDCAQAQSPSLPLRQQTTRFGFVSLGAELLFQLVTEMRRLKRSAVGLGAQRGTRPLRELSPHTVRASLVRRGAVIRQLLDGTWCLRQRERAHEPLLTDENGSCILFYFIFPSPPKPLFIPLSSPVVDRLMHVSGR